MRCVGSTWSRVEHVESFLIGVPAENTLVGSVELGKGVLGELGIPITTTFSAAVNQVHETWKAKDHFCNAEDDSVLDLDGILETSALEDLTHSEEFFQGFEPYDLLAHFLVILMFDTPAIRMGQIVNSGLSGLYTRPAGPDFL